MMGYDGGYGNMMGGTWYGDLLMLLFGALVVAGIVLLVIWVVRMSSGQAGAGGMAPPQGVAGQDEAVAIAKKRLAAGEITKEQFDEIVAVLKST